MRDTNNGNEIAVTTNHSKTETTKSPGVLEIHLSDSKLIDAGKSGKGDQRWSFTQESRRPVRAVIVTESRRIEVNLFGAVGYELAPAKEVAPKVKAPSKTEVARKLSVLAPEQLQQILSMLGNQTA